MSKPIHLLLRVLRDLVVLTLCCFIGYLPFVYLSAKDRELERKRIELQQDNIKQLILEEKVKEMKNIIDKQLEEMKADEKARKEFLGP